MKRFWAMFLVFALMAAFTSCSKEESLEPTVPPTSGQSEANAAPVEQDIVADHTAQEVPADVSPASKILVAYFTWAENSIVSDPNAVDVDAVTSASLLTPGNTAQIAAIIQNEVDGDLFSIQVSEPYPGEYEQCLARVERERDEKDRPALTGHVENINNYDVVFLGYPNWGYSAPMAIYTFLEQHDLTGKTVYIFGSNGTGGLAGTVNDVAAMIPDSTVVSDNVLSISRDGMKSVQVNAESWLASLGY